ncbi:hypothetical protein BH09PLA1_BH09PLA1_10130 [soil metagenome]
MSRSRSPIFALIFAIILFASARIFAGGQVDKRSMSATTKSLTKDSVVRFDELEPRRLLSAYVVATTGSDSAAGTTDAPWRTLQHAADRVAPGDTVNVRAGNYTGFQLENSGTRLNRITFRAELGVVIDHRNATTPDGINLEAASFITIRGFNVVGIERSGIRSVLNDGVQIIGNTCDRNGRWGIFTGFSENILIEGNIARRSVAEHGIYFGNSADNPIIRGNICWGNRACGIHVNSDLSQGGDGIISNALIENNTCWSNGAGGGSAINMDGVQNSIVRNNLIYNTYASGISLYRIDGARGAKNNFVVNNTIVMANSNTSPGRFAINIADGSTGNPVRNNICYSYHPSSGGRGSIQVSADSRSGLVSDYNIVNDTNGFSNNDTGQNLAQWRASTGQDAHSQVAAPSDLFNDTALSDYHLRGGSVAIDAGTGVTAPLVDMHNNGRPSNGAVDIGAFEYQNYRPPTNVQAKPANSTSIDVSWSDGNEGDTNFVIYRRTESGQWVKLRSVSAGRTSFRDTSAATGVRYFYRVYAYSAAGKSSASGTVAAIAVYNPAGG